MYIVLKRTRGMYTCLFFIFLYLLTFEYLFLNTSHRSQGSTSARISSPSLVDPNPSGPVVSSFSVVRRMRHKDNSLVMKSICSRSAVLKRSLFNYTYSMDKITWVFSVEITECDLLFTKHICLRRTPLPTVSE